MTVTIEQLAADKGYQFVKAKKGEDGKRSVTLEKDGRAVIVDDALVEDIVSMAVPVENADRDSPIKAVV